MRSKTKPTEKSKKKIYVTVGFTAEEFADLEKYVAQCSVPPSLAAAVRSLTKTSLADFVQ